VLEGANSGAIVDFLRGQGLTPVEIKETRATSPASHLNVTLFRQKVSHIDLLLFSRQMHRLLKSGVPIMRALSGLQEAAINPEMKRVIGEVRESLEGGRELSQPWPGIRAFSRRSTCRWFASVKRRVCSTKYSSACSSTSSSSATCASR
jgi:type II secretory pathway component PulF